jgi:medium-chain acyl-[acyl-carrier-protein] hydrolase
VRLFCFPYAGGGAAVFRLWARSLPAAIEVCPIELPGRGNRISEPPFRRIEPLAHAIADIIRPYLDKPYALFGHSLGAILAFDLARKLRREQQPHPVHLFASGCRAPHLLDRTSSRYDLPDQDLVEELRTLNGTPAEALANRELMAVMLPILRADFEALDTYVYAAEPPLQCPLTVFGGLHDDGITREELEAWREQTNAGVRVCLLPGDHFFVNTAPALLLRLIADELDDATYRCHVG